ncbi:GNAT family N-acetyltransferase [Paenibacillus sp. SI8]|uniref:GNAT family N-acetyltransferase n=1 Tax=unclassified Paenibacillus TaxID=185978 RepID=UPI0034669090
MKATHEHFIYLDAIAANTWPAEATGTFEHWQLRSSKGITKRANSVLAIGDYPKSPDWLHQIEAHYQALGLPALYHVSGASPEGLDAILEAEGYAIEFPCFLMTADCEEVKQRASQAMASKNPEAVDIVWANHADTAWLDAFMQLEQFPPLRRTFYADLLERMPTPKGFLKLVYENQTVALGTAIVEDSLAGFVNVVVNEAYRGRGFGYALLHAMTAWSIENGASSQYLQVVADNRPAVSLYSNLGYNKLYRYHYRTKYDL